MDWLLLPVASAASSGGRSHRRRGLNRKGLQKSIATSNIVSVALWGFDRQPRGSLFIPSSCGAPAHCGKIVPSCKVTGRLPIERKPADNVPQKKLSPPHSLLSSTARFSLSRCLQYWHQRRKEVTIPFFSNTRQQKTNKNETLTS